MNGPTERRLRRVAKGADALRVVPRNYSERLAQVEAAMLDETATDADFRWAFAHERGGSGLRSELLDDAEAILRGEERALGCSGMPDNFALAIITTPLGEPTPPDARRAWRPGQACSVRPLTRRWNGYMGPSCT